MSWLGKDIPDSALLLAAFLWLWATCWGPLLATVALARLLEK